MSAARLEERGLHAIDEVAHFEERDVRIRHHARSAIGQQCRPGYRGAEIRMHGSAASRRGAMDHRRRRPRCETENVKVIVHGQSYDRNRPPSVSTMKEKDDALSGAEAGQ